ncbi:MAG: recombinase RecT [Alphaproteobacteria bacterium]
MTTELAIANQTQAPPKSVLIFMADRYGMEAPAFEATVRATVCKGSVSREEFAAFLLVAKEHRLNPLTKEIFAFPAKGGGIQPIVSIDGWARIINEHPAFDGMTFQDELDGREVVAITCQMFRKDRSHPIAATEYMVECRRTTDVWKTWPRRMLRHKAMIQAARYAFGFSGIVDPDEYERITQVHTTERPTVRTRLLASGSEGFSSAVDTETGEVRDLDEVLDGDQIPTEEPAEAIDAEVGPVEPERVAEPATEAPAATDGPSLAQIATMYQERLQNASTTTKLMSLRTANTKLRERLDSADPERLADLEDLFNARFAELETLEAAQ